jgi:hypothetical protein
MNLTCEQTGESDLRIFWRGELVAEIQSLRLVFARFRPDGIPLIASTVPLSLFWMQYANHEDPDRNAGSHTQLRVAECRADRVLVECSGRTFSGACTSRVFLSVRATGLPLRFHYTIEASLKVVASSGWPVTPNPHHGEVEFANVWPEGTFVTGNERKRYNGCYVVHAGDVLRIPHHHLESSDKHNIPLVRGDQFCWLLEEENPCITILSEQPVVAGLCGYMWDAHFAYRVCPDDRSVVLPAGAGFEASYTLSCLERAEAEGIARAGRNRPVQDADQIPVYVDGVNRFSGRAGSTAVEGREEWPWETESDGQGGADFRIDRSTGVDDSSSLRIDSSSPGFSCWKVTALGPAYGKRAYAEGSRFRLTAYVRSENLAGRATLALRLHREGHGSVFRLEDYEVYASEMRVQGNTGWTKVEALSPPISPAPDRLHILLVHDGPGTSWFDNVLLEVVS